MIKDYDFTSGLIEDYDTDVKKALDALPKHKDSEQAEELAIKDLPNEPYGYSVGIIKSKATGVKWTTVSHVSTAINQYKREVDWAKRHKDSIQSTYELYSIYLFNCGTDTMVDSYAVIKSSDVDTDPGNIKLTMVLRSIRDTLRNFDYTVGESALPDIAHEATVPRDDYNISYSISKAGMLELVDQDGLITEYNIKDSLEKDPVNKIVKQIVIKIMAL